MKVAGKKAATEKPRKKREIGGANAKTFTAEIVFRGKQNGEAFRTLHEVDIKASNMIGAAGRAAREAFVLAKKERGGKCKWMEATVIVYPGQ